MKEHHFQGIFGCILVAIDVAAKGQYFLLSGIGMALIVVSSLTTFFGDFGKLIKNEKNADS